jgi:hypothetical protein
MRSKIEGRMCPAYSIRGHAGEWGGRGRGLVGKMSRARIERSSQRKREREREREAILLLNPLSDNLMTKLAEEISDKSAFSE